MLTTKHSTIASRAILVLTSSVILAGLSGTVTANAEPAAPISVSPLATHGPLPLDPPGCWGADGIWYPDCWGPGQWGPGQWGPGMMGPGQWDPGMMGPGQWGPGTMGPGMMGPGQWGPGMMGPWQWVPGVMGPGDWDY